MTTSVQRRRGTTTQHSTFTGLEGELTIDTTKDTAVIHDGATVGGFPLAKEGLENAKTSSLTALAKIDTASDDTFLIYDNSASAMKKITKAELLGDIITIGGDLSGSASAPTVSKIQNRSVSSTAPADGEAYVWNALTSTWIPNEVGLKAGSITAGTSISVTENLDGTVTIANTAPDQTVGITGAGTVVVSGTYPNFTITANDEFDGTVTSVGATGGTGISITGSPITGSGSFTITNTAPDQVITLTGTGSTTVTGTYPDFTISSIGGGTSLPTQTGHAGEWLKTDGTDASWNPIPTYIPVKNYAGSSIQVAATLGYLPVKNYGGSTINVPLY